MEVNLKVKPETTADLALRLIQLCKMGRSLSKQNVRRMGRWCGWAAVALLLFTMLTGYGISSFRIVTTLTFGILDKATSHRWHHYTDIPVLIFLSVHMVIALWLRLGSRLRMRS